uniref:MFS transporter n=1 Tax=Actinomyces timonensis TaxID=1288391 RepID=UPI003F54D676
MPLPSLSSPTSQVTGTARATLRALLAIVLFTYVAQNMLNASIAPLARALGLREWIVGLAVSLAALTVASLSQFWGRRSIAWGRRRVLLSALALAMIAGCLFAAAVGLRSAGLLGAGAAAVAVVAARGPFFGGAVAAIPPTGQALIAEMTPDERARVRGLSAFAGAVQMSILIGSVVSSALGAWSILAPVYATPAFVAIALLIGLLWIPHDGARPPSEGEAPLSSPAGAVPGGAPAPRATALPPRVSWRDPRLLPWIGSGLGMFFSAGVVQIIVGFIVQDRLGLPPERAVSLTALMLLANAAGAMLMQLVAVPRLGWPPQRLIRIGLAITLVALVSLALAPALPMMIISTLFLGAAMGLVGPGFTAGGSLAVTAAEQGGVAGILNATGAVTWVFAPVTATALYGWRPLAPFGLALAVLTASVTVAWTHPGLRGRSRRVPAA